jgi:hypothetical protein
MDKDKLQHSAMVYEFPVLKHGFLKQPYFGKPVDCSSDGCGTQIQNGVVMFVDTETEPHAAYCYVCGPVKRYERKKEKARAQGDT